MNQLIRRTQINDALTELLSSPLANKQTDCGFSRSGRKLNADVGGIHTVGHVAIDHLTLMGEEAMDFPRFQIAEQYFGVGGSLGRRLHWLKRHGLLSFKFQDARRLLELVKRFAEQR
jgi:hypothetical protein